MQKILCIKNLKYVLRAFSLSLLSLVGCSKNNVNDTEVGKQLMMSYGCVSCHEHDGMNEARGRVGPPLNEFYQRSYIAGTLPNTRENLILWLMDPREVNPNSAMPNVGLSYEQADALSDLLLGFNVTGDS